MDTEKQSTTAKVLQMRFMRIIKFFLYLMGAWPADAFGEYYPYLFLVYRKMVVVLTMLVPFGNVYFVYSHFSELTFFVMADVFITMNLAIMTTPKAIIINLQMYSDSFRDFVSEYHLMHYKSDDKYAHYVTSIANKLSNWVSVYSAISVFCAVTLFNFSPLYNSIKNGALSSDRPKNASLEFAVLISYPGLDCYEHFIITSIYNFISTYNCAVIVCIFGLLIMILVFNIIGHIKILLHEVGQLHKISPESENDTLSNTIDEKMFSEEENKVFRKRLITIVNHHRLIVRFSEQVSSCFGIIIAANLWFHLINGCMLLILSFSKNRAAVSRFGPVTVINFWEVIQVNVIYELVGVLSEQLIDDLYQVPWERTDTSNRRCIAILLQRVQRPIRLTAAGVINIGVDTMVKIIKTNISYFMFFKKFN